MAKDLHPDEAPEFGAEIAALRKEIEALAATVARIGRAGAAGLHAKAEETLGSGADTLGGVEERILGEARTHPWRTLGLAALGGLVLGLILRR